MTAATTAARTKTCTTCGGPVAGPTGRVHIAPSDRERCAEMRKAAANVVTGKQIATAAGIGPRTKKVVIRDEYGFIVSGQQRRYADVLAILCRSDLTADLSERIHTVAYALRKCMTSARMPAESENRIAAYTPYQICAVVARVANECPETTIGGICDVWLLRHHTEL